MSLTAKHGLYFAGLGSTTIGGITRQSIAVNSDVNGEPNSGEVYRRWLALYAQKIAPGFTSNSIKAA
jgi:hypothetical protein